MVLLALTACSSLTGWPDPPGGETTPREQRIVVTPSTLDFGTISVGADGTAEAVLTLYNLGDTDELISGHDEPIGSAAFEVDAEPIVSLRAGFSTDFRVRYRPDTEQSDSAELLVDPGGETVRLLGAATAPVIEIGHLVADPVVVGCAGTATLDVRNAGSEVLEIGDVTIGSEEFSLVSAPSSVEPGGTAVLTLSFTPDGGGARGAALTIASNDPHRPEVGTSLSVLGYEGERVTESFRYTPSNPTDILFVLVTGDGMTAQLDKASVQLPGFVDALRTANLDYHLTALSGAGPCPSSRPGWADRGDTSLQAQSVLEQGLDGGSGPFDDALLSLALAALDASEAGGCLEGFRRVDADLRVIVVSDRPSSGSATTAAAALGSGVPAPATLTIDALLPETTACGTLAPDYDTAVRGTGGSTFDLCASDWGSAFSAFADVPEGRDAVRFAFAEEPVERTIEVTSEGVRFTDWTWDPTDGAIVFDGDVVPALGAEISVSYVSAVACQ